MAENATNCPVCGSELFISGRVIYCSNPRCNYSNVAPIRAYKEDYLKISLLPFAFLIIAIGLILIFISLIFFTTTLLFIFIPFIIPIPILRKLIKRRQSTQKHKSEV